MKVAVKINKKEQIKKMVDLIEDDSLLIRIYNMLYIIMFKGKD